MKVPKVLKAISQTIGMSEKWEELLSKFKIDHPLFIANALI